ncbi:DUF4132 domain-containing protein [Actinorugispora endophytica]|uniref:DUF4132 domain-containing protein n=1 Tax=Actinorugispora endophytica TaxID=1605990 RepID=A0A4V3D8U9_9ACTN|nr:DUF4132 domain-containing protein [Actinorugispora endophytica]TDQ53289.1 hypothetical protein EV190_10478 [Actinorugispora endophytica]
MTSTNPLDTTENDDAVWLPGPDGYELALGDGGLRCRNARGRVLKRLPKQVADSEPARRLGALQTWLDEHAAACLRQARAWTRGSWPVPVPLLRRVWADPAWRGVLRDSAVGTRAGDAPGAPLTTVGLLRGIDAGGRIGVLTLDAETAWLETDHLVFPHPQHIPELEDVRDLVLELGSEPGTDQLLRSDRPLESRSGMPRGLLLDALAAPVHERTALSVDAPGHPDEQAVRARVYRHPSLGDRPVVRLASDTDGLVLDVVARRLGCAAPEPGPAVAATRRSALLGYPAWALVRDPEHADTALTSPGVFARALEEAGDKPGRSFDTLRYFARRLPFSHLPAFWAQAQNVFREAGNWHWTARCRAAAKEALAEAGMTGDLELRRALLAEGLDDLGPLCDAVAEREGPAAAYAEYRSRVRWASDSETTAFRDLRRLARAAGLDTAEEDVRNLGDFFADGGHSGSVSFWRSHAPAMTRLARADDAFLRRLLCRGGGGLWFLDSKVHGSGLLKRLLADPVVARRLREGVLSPGVPIADWLGDDWLVPLRSTPSHASAAVLELVAFLAPALVAGGRGLRLAAAEDDPVDANVLDVVLEHGIPLAHPVRNLSLTEWHRSGEARRPLAHLAADPRFGALLEREVAAFEGAPEPPTGRGGHRRGKPAPFTRAQLLEFPALAPVVARVHPDLAPPAPPKAGETGEAGGGPAVSTPPPGTDAQLDSALEGLLLRLPYSKRSPKDRYSTLASLRGAAALLSGGEAEEAAPEEPRLEVPWGPLLAYVGAVALRAASAAASPEERAALAAFLRAWAELPPVADPGRGWQYGALVGEPPEGDGTAVLHRVDYANHSSAFGPDPVEVSGYPGDGVRWFLRRSPAPGAPDPLSGRTAFVRDVDPGWATAEGITAFLGELDRRGPLPWGKPARTAAERLGERIGVTPAAAALVLNGFPLGGDSKKPLTDLRRRALKLTVRDTKAALARLGRLDGAQRLRLAAAVVPPGGPAPLWDKGGLDDAVDRVAAAWHGEGDPHDLVDAATAAAAPRYAGPAVLSRLQAPGRAAALTRAPDSTVELAPYRQPGLPSAWLRSNLKETAQLVSWAAVRLPAGHRARRELPTVLALARERLSDPGLVVRCGWVHLARTQAEQNRVAREVFGPRTLRDGTHAVYDDGVFIVGVHPRYPTELLFRPALLEQRWDEPEVATKRRLLADSYGDFALLCAYRELLFGDGYTRLAERAAATPVPEGGYELNPLHSAPGLVAEVGAGIGVGEDAAALYLQLAALAVPTDDHVRTWNGWSPERHGRAQRELLGSGAVVPRPERETEADLVVEGRSVVLPGPLARVYSPFHTGFVTEERKRALLPLLPGATHRDRSLLEPGLAHRPPHELFEEAWNAARSA